METWRQSGDSLAGRYLLYRLHPVSVQPWHRNVGRAILQTPKVYFFDTGLVRGDEGVRFENAVATMLLKHVHFRQDARGKAASLHYIRTKDGAAVQIVRHLRQEESRSGLRITRAADWLHALEA
jgi:predicted AAA+ superfamily ATPase